MVGVILLAQRLSQGLEQAGIRAGSLKFAEVVEQLGGIRQISRVIPLLKEFGKAQEALNVGLAGSTSLNKDVAKAQETVAQAFARTQENFSALIREISQTETFQAFVKIALDLANAFIEVARSIKPLIPLIGALGAIKLGGIATQAIKRAGSSSSVLQFARGGVVPGSGNGDTVPAMLEPGEFVIRKSAVQAFGAENLGKINKYAKGSTVSALSGLQARVLKDFISSPGISHTKDAKTQISPNKINLTPNDRVTKNIKQVQLTPAASEKELIALNTAPGEARRGLLWEKLLIRTNNLQGSGKRFGPNAPTDGFYKSKLADAFYGIRPGSSHGQSSLRAKLLADNLLYGNKLQTQKLTRSSDNITKLRDLVELIPSKQFRNRVKEANKKAAGGSISGTGTDTVPALLTPGEFVVNKKSAEAYGYGNLKKINKYAKGGVVQKFADGGFVDSAQFKPFGGNNQSKKELAVIDKIVLEYNKKIAKIKAVTDQTGKEIVSAKKLETLKQKFEKSLQSQIDANKKLTAGNKKRLDSQALLSRSERTLAAANKIKSKSQAQRSTNLGLKAGDNATAKFFAFSALAQQFDILSIAVKKVSSLFPSLGNELSALGSALVDTVAKVAVFGFALSTVGVNFGGVFKQLGANIGTALKPLTKIGGKFTKIGTALGGAGGAIAQFGNVMAVAAVAAGAVSYAFSRFIDNLYDFEARKKNIEEEVKKGRVGVAVAEAQAFNEDAEVANSGKIGGGIAAGAAAGAIIGSVIPVVGTAVGVAVGAALGAAVGGLVGFYNRTEELNKEEIRRRATLYKSLIEANEEEKRRKEILGDVNLTQGQRDQALAASSNKQLAQLNNAVKIGKNNLKIAKQRGDSEEELKKFQEDLSAATEAQKQAIEAQTQEVLSSITAIAAQDLSIKDYTDVVKKLTPAQRQQIKTLGISQKQLENATDAQVLLNQEKIKELQLLTTKLNLEKQLNDAVNQLTVSIGNLSTFAASIRGEQTFDSGSRAIQVGPSDPNYQAAIRAAGVATGQQSLANDVIQLRGVIENIPASFARVSNIQIGGGTTKQVQAEFNKIFSNINIQDPELNKQLDILKQDFQDAIKSDDVAKAAEAFKKSLETLQKSTEDFEKQFGSVAKLIEDQLKTYSGLLGEYNNKVSAFIDSTIAASDKRFERAKRITELQGGSVTRADIQAQTQRNIGLADRRLQGVNGIGLARVAGLRSRLASQPGRLPITTATPDATNQVRTQKALELSADRAAKALAEYNKGLEAQADVVEQQIQKEKSLTDTRRSFAQQLVFGTDESRISQLTNLRNAQIAARQGGLTGATGEQRQGILSILQQFENAAVFGGRTGAEVQGEIMANELLRAGLINPQQAKELRKGVSSKETKLINDLSDIYKEQSQIEIEVLKNEQANVNNFGQSVTRFGLAVDALAAGQPVGPQTYVTGGMIYANQGTLVNFKPKGTDTVPAMLTPGEFVIKKSSVDKYGTGMMEQINAGNFAVGGVVNPIYRQHGENIDEPPSVPVPPKAEYLRTGVKLEGRPLDASDVGNFYGQLKQALTNTTFGISNPDETTILRLFASKTNRNFVFNDLKTNKKNIGYSPWSYLSKILSLDVYEIIKGSFTANQLNSLSKKLEKNKWHENFLKDIKATPARKDNKDGNTNTSRKYKSALSEEDIEYNKEVEAGYKRQAEKAKQERQEEEAKQRKAQELAQKYYIEAREKQATEPNKIQPKVNKYIKTAKEILAPKKAQAGRNLKEFIDQVYEEPDFIKNQLINNGIKIGRITDPNIIGKNEAQWIINKITGNEEYIPPLNAAFEPLFGKGISVLDPEQRRRFIYMGLLAKLGNEKAAYALNVPQFERQYQLEGRDKLAKYFNTGGPVGGDPGIDVNPAMLTRGEYVINKDSAQAIGLNNLNRLNSIKKYNKGGAVGYYQNGGEATGGLPSMNFDQFVNGVDKFDKSIINLKGILEGNTIPSEITMTLGNQVISVNLNGAEVLQNIMPEIQKLVTGTVVEEISSYHNMVASDPNSYNAQNASIKAMGK
jgi:hypothetical protein